MKVERVASETLVKVGVALIVVGIVLLVLCLPTDLLLSLINPLTVTFLGLIIVLIGLTLFVVKNYTLRVGLKLLAGALEVLVIIFFIIALFKVNPMAFLFAYHDSRTFEFNGDLTGVDELVFNVKGTNIVLTVKGWSKSEYSVSVTLEVYSWSSRELSAILKSCKPSFEIKRAENKAILKLGSPTDFKGSEFLRVLIEVKLPNDLSSNIKVAGVNGKMIAEDLSVNSIDISLNNGEVKVDNLRARSLRIELTNGVVKGSVTIESANLKLINGIIDIDCKPLRTSCVNASLVTGVIKLVIRGEELGEYWIDAKAHIGFVKVSERSLSRYSTSVNLKTEGYEEAKAKVRVTLRVEVGIIAVRVLSGGAEAV